MIKIFLIRHGEAVGQGRYLGRGSDPELSDYGRTQVEALKSMLPSTQNSLLYTSPLKRAYETSGMLFDKAAGSAGIKILEDFSEMDFGIWEGLNWQEISASAGAEYRAWLENPSVNCPPGGEKLDSFNARVERGLKSVLNDCLLYDKKTVFITAHGGIIRSALCLFLGLRIAGHWSFRVDPASLSCVSLTGAAGALRPCRIEFLNTTVCLPPPVQSPDLDDSV